MLPDRVSNPGPLTCESGALPIALRGPAMMLYICTKFQENISQGFRVIERMLFVYRNVQRGIIP